MRDDVPTGTVTFLFTDVEGSTKLLRALGAEAYAGALAEHRRIVREACSAQGGVEVDTQGDAFFFAFSSAPGALAAAQTITDSLAAGPIHLRIGLHTGTPLVTGEGYVGDDVHLASRVAASGHGGQVVLSAATRELVDSISLTDLGEHRLKDVDGAVSIFQLGSTRFPPLKTISNTNLPRPVSSFIGRGADSRTFSRSSRTAHASSRSPARAARARPASRWRPQRHSSTPTRQVSSGSGLAALRDPALVTETIAQTLGAKDGLAEHVAERELLLLLDNLEQVIEAASDLSALLAACPNLALLVTSRELLRVQGEVEYEVPPLASAEAVTLFCERSRLEPSEEIAELCARLDDLPLAVELAAARTKALSPSRILDRLAERLDLLKGGRDADPRQQTLRATIEWSCGLLTEEEQRIFRALSVFAGGCTLNAAEEVCSADVDTMQSLVEKSLVRFSDERYWMLETIHEYAREQLNQAGGTRDHALRHAYHYLSRLEALELVARELRTDEPLAWYAAEEDNVRAMLDSLSEWAPVDGARGAYLLRPFWGARGAFSEARERYKTLLTGTDLPDESRAMLLERIADFEERLGDLDTADIAVREALTLAESADARPIHADALRISARIASRGGRHDEAVRMARRAAEEAEMLDAERRIHALHDLGVVLTEAGYREEARAVLRSTAEEARSVGHVLAEVSSVGNLGFLELHEHNFEAARTSFLSALEPNRKIDHYATGAHTLMGLGHALLGLERPREARAAFAEMLDIVLAGRQPLVIDFAYAASGIALTTGRADFAEAARLRGAVARLRQDVEFSSKEEDLERLFERPLISALGEGAFAHEQAIGAAMSLEDAIALARSLADRSRIGVVVQS